MAVSLINLNTMLLFANTANAVVTQPGFKAKKPIMFKLEPVIITGHIPENQPPNPSEDKPITVAGKEYKSIDDFLLHIRYHKNVHVEGLTPEMKKEVVKFYELASKKGVRFQLMCAYRTEEENKRRKRAAIRAGHPEAVGNDSLHKEGRAIDINTKDFSEKQKMILINIWQNKMGHRSGINFSYSEPWHFDLGLDSELKKLSDGQKNRKPVNTKA